MPLIDEVLDDRKLWVIISSRKENGQTHELEIIKPLMKKLNEEWFLGGDFIWAGSFDDNKTSMVIFETTEEKARKYFAKYDKICLKSLENKLYQWDALPLLSILARIEKKI